MSTAPAHLNELPDTAAAARIAEQRKQDALEHWQEIITAAGMESTTSLTIGFNAHYIKKNGLFGMLGFEHEGEAQEASGVGKSTWFSCIRLAEAYDGLTKEQFVSMKLLNAQALMDLPESKRKSREWIRMAGSMKTKDFRQRVDEEMEGKARSSDSKERGVRLTIDMPLSRKKSVEEGLKEIAAQVGVENGDISRTLEIVVAEKRGETTLVGAITHACQRVREAKELQNSGLSAEETLTKVYAIMDDMVLEFSKALPAVSE